jgi:hypothetical protein
VSDTTKVGCHGCGATNEVPAPVSRRESCSRCGAELRCCVNCAFHDRSAYNECREPSAERVVDKDRANFCDYFAPKGGASSTAAAGSPTTSDLERLFAKNK